MNGCDSSSGSRPHSNDGGRPVIYLIDPWQTFHCVIPQPRTVREQLGVTATAKPGP